MHNIPLLVLTDFDGTIYRYGRDAHAYPAFAAVLADLRRHGARWAVCTGRPLSSVGRATRAMARDGVHPDVIVAKHRWVHECRDGSWRFLPRVSLRIAWRTAKRKAELADHLRAILDQARKSFASCRVSEIAARQYRLQFRDAEEAQRALESLTRTAPPDSAIHMARSERDIELHGVSFSKAVAARTVAEYLHVSPDRSLAIGDGHSDLGMLGPDVARMTGCPLNASRETVQAVIDAGGHVSAETALLGTMDVIHAWTHGEVRSVPPATWQPPHGKLWTGARPTDVNRSRFWIGVEIAMIVCAFLLGFLVLTTFGVIRLPDFLTKPFTRAAW